MSVRPFCTPDFDVFLSGVTHIRLNSAPWTTHFGGCWAEMGLGSWVSMAGSASRSLRRVVT